MQNKNLLHADGCHPSAFQGSEGMVQNKADKLWYYFQIEIAQVAGKDPKKQDVNFDSTLTYVICYLTKHVHKGSDGRHCILLDSANQKGWIGLNSWGKYDKTPTIGFTGNEVEIYQIEVKGLIKVKYGGGSENLLVKLAPLNAKKKSPK